MHSSFNNNPELKHIKIFQNEVSAREFAIHYSIDNKKYYYNESLIEGNVYDAKFYEFEGYECDSEEEYELVLQKSNQMKKELGIENWKNVRIAIDKVVME